MSGKVIPAILGVGRRFPGIGPPPTFWPLMVSLETVMVLMDVSFSLLMYYDEHILRLKVYWKFTCQPSWTYLVLISLCHVLGLCHSFKVYFLLSSFLFPNNHPSPSMSWEARMLSSAAHLFSMNTGRHLIYFFSGLLWSSNDIMDMKTHWAG